MSRLPYFSTLRLTLIAIAVLSTACGDKRPDPRTVEGTLTWAAQKIEARDRRSLFRVIDQRARHAMASIVADRRRAAELIRASYAEEVRTEALAELGDGAAAEDAAALFALRCDDSCLRELAATIGAPERTEPRGEELLVHTVRGTTVRLYRAREGDWYGIIWRTPELQAERIDANRDLDIVQRNVSVYQRRRQLEARTDSAPP